MELSCTGLVSAVSQCKLVLLKATETVISDVPSEKALRCYIIKCYNTVDVTSRISNPNPEPHAPNGVFL